jgi:hypothetical protein
MVSTPRDEPKLSELFIAYMLARNARVEEDLVDQLFSCSESVWPGRSSCWPNFGKEGKPEPIIPKVSQETLAEIVGTTQARVSTFMNNLGTWASSVTTRTPKYTVHCLAWCSTISRKSRKATAEIRDRTDFHEGPACLRVMRRPEHCRMPELLGAE